VKIMNGRFEEPAAKYLYHNEIPTRMLDRMADGTTVSP
jgi:hypothetical protein